MNPIKQNEELHERKKMEKTRTSFYIDKQAQDSLKKVSDSYGISQGEIINWAPFLFGKVIENSLERRRRSLPTLRTLSHQIGASIEAIKSIAPHLSRSFDLIFQQIITVIIDLEEKAVNDKVVSGIGDYSEEGLDRITDAPIALERILIENEESDPAYKKDLLEMLGVVDPNSILNFFQSRPQGEDSHD